MHSRANTRGPVIVVGRKGSHGKVQFSEQPVFAIDTTYFVDESLTPHDLRWLFHAFSTLRLDTLTQDVGVPGLSREDAYTQRLSVPPRSGQRAIADFLDTETARIDALVSKKRQMIDLLEERLEGARDDVLWNGTDVVGPLMHLTDTNRQIMYGIVFPGPDVDDGIPIVKGGDVALGFSRRLSRTTTAIEAGYARSRLKADDLVFAIRGGVGDVARVPAFVAGANITQDVARVAPAEGVDVAWLRHVLMSPTVQTEAAARTTGATIRGLNIWDLKRLTVPMTDPRRQAHQRDELDELERVTTGVSVALTRQIELLREHRQALITAAVTGELEVPGVVA